MKNILISLGIVVVIFSLHSCSYDDGELAYPATSLNDTMHIDSSANIPVSYVADIQPIMVTYCYGTGSQTCHVTVSNQGANGDFTTYAGVKAKVDNGSLIARVFSPNGGMPPSYSNGLKVLSASDAFKLKTWINRGAPNN